MLLSPSSTYKFASIQVRPRRLISHTSPRFNKEYAKKEDPKPLSINSNTNTSSQRASDKLFADAALEEQLYSSASQVAPESNPARLASLEQATPNWDGEERLQDTVLRMLMDKYKPLRTGVIQTADEKLKTVAGRTPLRPHIEDKAVEGKSDLSSTTLSPTPSGAVSGNEGPPLLKPKTGSWATEPLLPSKEGHQPWHTVFKIPSHESPAVKSAQDLPPSPLGRKTLAALDDKARRKELGERKRGEFVGRLTKAKEGILDYKLGIKGAAAAGVGGVEASGPNPINMKGWNSLIEEKIEKARLAGVFENVKGRGQPIKRVTDEFNPFIAREEFLMNRIIQRNGAAPPWVQIQIELEASASAFRGVLRQSWIRRAVRMTSASNPPELLQTFTMSDVRQMRDLEWERREYGYHTLAVEELNSMVRKHNGLAPYAVRRPYYMLKIEIDRMYEDCAKDIYNGLREASLRASTSLLQNDVIVGPSQARGGTAADGDKLMFLQLRCLIRALFGRLIARMLGRGV